MENTVFLDQLFCKSKMALKNRVISFKKSLEPIIQSEVSQKEKYQYSILTHIYRI